MKKRHLLTIGVLFIVFICRAQSISFNNPLVEQRADPWVYKAKSGVYYYTATVPAYDRVILRRAGTIDGLANAPEKVIWSKHEAGTMANHIWAPELHRIDDVWYIYFAAGHSEDKWKIRMWVLSNTSEDPFDGDWNEEGQVQTKTDGFALDATTFEHAGKRYLIWAESVLDGEGGTGLVLSEFEHPTQLVGPEVILTKPEYEWERQKYNVNEGPAVIKRNGKIFVTYSASATNHNYCIGLLWIDEQADLLNPANWNKAPSPVFHSNAQHNRFGPGHNSFTVAEDGESSVMVYHARDYESIQGHELDDPNRATYAREVNWTISGFPDFRQHSKD
ncbi:MAG: family 43 glycosylhydrolase [Cyclobacteriaceae bacterium]